MSQSQAIRIGERNLVERGTRDAIGGALRPADPRRFLVEAMVGAMVADGSVDARELAVLERHVAEHDLFQGIPAAAARTIVELARDAMTFAGTPCARLPAIARGLPSRIHRLTAYAMAWEVVRADGEVAPSERAFLEALRHHLRVAPHEALAVLAALDAGRVAAHLDERVHRIRGLAPAAAELFALHASFLGRVDDVQRGQVRDRFGALPDLAGLPDELDAILRAAFARRRRPGAPLEAALRELAATVPDVVDRWWLTVYLMTAQPAPRFLAMVQGAFGLGDDDLALAAGDARMCGARTP